ncbi:MAG: leucine-rich repeat domain-containing protein, partial [Clostridia bacterium]|nr:leucine-rich repeat domain-containing protein [Clostridia bacterium]
YNNTARSIYVPAQNNPMNEVSYPLDGGNIYFDKTTGMITGADEGIIVANIPEKIDGISVKAIGENAFTNQKMLITVTMPKSITSIAKGAFCYCEAISSIDMPKSLTSIYNDAFLGCSGLENIYYSGTEEQWNRIWIGENNTPLSDATIQYKYMRGFRTDPATGETVACKVADNTLTVSGDVSASSPVCVALFDENGRLVSIEVMNAPGTADVGAGVTAKIIWLNAEGFTAKSESMEFELS